MAQRITKEEGIKLLNGYGTPQHVIRHCIAVTDTAVSIAEAMNRSGYDLNIPLITGAAILHDICRVEENHDIAGSGYAVSLGLEEEAAIIREHMRYRRFSEPEHVNETDIVCLSDRVVKEDSYVGVDERFEYIADKARSRGADESVIERIYQSREKTRDFISEIERITGCRFDEICSREGN